MRSHIANQTFKTEKREASPIHVTQPFLRFFQPLISRTEFIELGFIWGFMIGSTVFGVMADRLGRRPAMLTSVAVSSLTSFVGAFMSNYWVFWVNRFICGVATEGMYMAGFILVIESTGPDFRGRLASFLKVRELLMHAIDCT